MPKEHESLTKVMEEKTFVIADYQRPYAWTDKQLSDLWGDLDLLGRGEHYAGTLVLRETREQKITSAGELLREYEVVDGQQRLTTITILLSRLLARLESLATIEDSDLAEGVDEAKRQVRRLVQITRQGGAREERDLWSETSHTALGDFTHTINAYDARDQVNDESWTWPAGITNGFHTYEQTYTRNDADQLKTQSDPAVADLAAENLTMTYGDGGYFKEEDSDALTGSGLLGVANAQYGTVGHLTELDSGAGTNELLRSYDYYPDSGLPSSNIASAPGGHQYVNLEYLLDQVGQPRAILDHTMTGTRAATCDKYDGAHRLTQSFTGHLTTAGDYTSCQQDASTSYAAKPFDIDYSYDAAGSLQNVDFANTAGSGNPSNAYNANYSYTDPTHHPHAAQSVDDGPAAGVYTFGASGKLTEWGSLDSTNSRVSTYTPLGQLETTSLSHNGTATGHSTFAYWPDGSRAETSTNSGPGTTTTTTISAGDTTLTTPSTSGRGLGSTAAIRDYTTPDGDQVAERDAASTWNWTATEQQGSVLATVYHAGLSAAVVLTHYYPYGEPTVTGRPDRLTGIGYIGQPHTGIDTSTTVGNAAGNANAAIGSAPGDTISTGVRDYNSSLGRFTTPDPLLNLTDPQSLNPYSYSADNPTTYSDPTGAMHEDDGTGGANTAKSRADTSWLDNNTLNLSNQDLMDFRFAIDREYAILNGTYNPYAMNIGIGDILSATGEIYDYTFTGGVFHSCTSGSGAQCAAGVASLIPVNRWIEGARVALAADRLAANAGTKLPEALTLGRNAEEGVHVYYGTSGGKNVYAGITNNVERRGIEHGDRFVLNPITTDGLTRGEARAVEQALIVRNPGFENIRNRISPNHAWYQDAVDWGEAWLQRNGY